MSGNKWHLLHEREDKSSETLCGRTQEDEAFTSKTARLVTNSVEQFEKRPCNKCLKIFVNRRDGIYMGKKYNVDDWIKKIRLCQLK